MTPDNTPQAINRLIRIVAALRSPRGCPWDRDQTPASLRRFLLEEAYEVLEALDQEDITNIRLELGDLLLQIVLLSRMFEESGLFGLSDVANGIADKLVLRHPHVFQGTDIGDRDDLDRQWDRIKAAEKEGGKRKGVLAGIPRRLPALLRAQKVTERAARVGFDWPDRHGVEEKIAEEVAEFLEACGNRSPVGIENEFGDLLFSLVNLARFLDISAEDALRKTIGRFQRRFEFIEENLREKGKTIEESSLDEMNLFWERAKQSIP
ncbi:MAG: nucleoside triphosphate pyrophosphohydrolase [Desulfuromonadaceae bacterium]|nr:nucleoside triphosphate pyrophosphohydrolase [Desulfuromonadaceae bacterium]